MDLRGTPGPAFIGTNIVAGNFAAQGGANAGPSIGINEDAFNNGTTYTIAIVGWSSSLGNSWDQVSSEYSSDNWIAHGYFGFEVGLVDPNGSVPGNIPNSIWGNNTLVLYSTVVPEPTTLALTGLGALSIFLRRRNGT